MLQTINFTKRQALGKGMFITREYFALTWAAILRICARIAPSIPGSPEHFDLNKPQLITPSRFQEPLSHFTSGEKEMGGDVSQWFLI